MKECLFCVCGKISNSSFCEVPCYYNKGVSFIRRAAEEEQNIDPQPMTFGFVGLKITKRNGWACDNEYVASLVSQACQSKEIGLY